MMCHKPGHRHENCWHMAPSGRLSISRVVTKRLDKGGKSNGDKEWARIVDNAAIFKVCSTVQKDDLKVWGREKYLAWLEKMGGESKLKKWVDRPDKDDPSGGGGKPTNFGGGAGGRGGRGGFGDARNNRNFGSGGGGGYQKSGGGHGGNNRACLEADEIQEELKPAYLGDDSLGKMTMCVSMVLLKGKYVGLQYHQNLGIHLPTFRIQPMTAAEWKIQATEIKGQLSSMIGERFSFSLNPTEEWAEEYDPTFCLRTFTANILLDVEKSPPPLVLQWNSWEDVIRLYAHFTWGESKAIKMGFRNEKLTTEESDNAWKGSSDVQAVQSLLSRRKPFTLPACIIKDRV